MSGFKFGPSLLLNIFSSSHFHSEFAPFIASKDFLIHFDHTKWLFQSLQKESVPKAQIWASNKCFLGIWKPLCRWWHDKQRDRPHKASISGSIGVFDNEEVPVTPSNSQEDKGPAVVSQNSPKDISNFLIIDPSVFSHWELSIFQI